MKLPSKTAQDREVREFKVVLARIIDKMADRIGNETALNNLFTGKHGSSSKLTQNHSIYRENPEELTKRLLIEPLLLLLGYEDIAYETSTGANRKNCDYGLILDGEKEPCERTVILVEAKPMLLGLNREIRGQLDGYLTDFNATSIYTPYFGILTDGLIWELHSLKKDGKTVVTYRVDIQPFMMWGLLKSEGKRPEFPMATYRKFRTIFKKNNIQTYANCLRFGVQMTMPDINGKIVPVDSIEEESVRREPKTNSIQKLLVSAYLE